MEAKKRRQIRRTSRKYVQHVSKEEQRFAQEARAYATRHGQYDPTAYLAMTRFDLVN